MVINVNSSIQNNFLNVSNINSGLDQNNLNIKNKEEQEGKDTVFISPLGKINNLIEVLMKQKQNINEMKNELIGRTLEKGEDIDSIKSQLECFEEQIKNIEEQIAQTMVEQSKLQAESQKEMIYKKPKTEEEIETERLNSIVNLSSNLSQLQVISSMKTKAEGESKVLETEIKLDESRGGVSTYKRENLADLQKQLTNLAAQINEELIEIDKEIKDNNGNQIIKTEKTKIEIDIDDNII